MAMAEDDVIPLEGDDEPLSVGQELTAAAAGPRSIRAFGQSATTAHGAKKFSRALNLTGAGATRCRIFHSKVTVAALDHMANQINEWLDAEQVEIKAVNQVVGVMEGKTPEPNVIVMVWF
jgi:hypothetical protein